MPDISFKEITLIFFFTFLSDFLEFPWNIIADLCAIGSFIILFGKGILKWYQKNYSKPNICISMIVKPLSNNEKYEECFIIPKNTKQVLFFRVKAQDGKEYKKPLALVNFKKDFIIHSKYNYTKIKFGKTVSGHRDYTVAVHLQYNLIKDTINDPLIFPLVITSLTKTDTYKIDVEIQSESMKKSKKQELTITVTDKPEEYSHSLSYFKPESHEKK